MRTLTDHIVEGDSANHQLTIEVTDEPGQGGANHRYEVSGFDTAPLGLGDLPGNPSAVGADGYRSSFSRMLVLFQNGPIKEFGVNGVTQEVFLAIVIDRLRSFQAGPYASPDNEHALADCLSALSWLQERTRKRIARGVEGTNAA